MERKYLPQKQGMLRRDYVIDVLMTGLDYPLITLIAGPGYGKTAVAAQFVRELPHQVAWVNLTPLDNDHNHFWHKIISAFQYEFSDFSTILSEKGFPNEGHEFDGYFNLVAKELAPNQESVVVFDNFGVLAEGPVRSLLEATISMQFNNLCIVLISTNTSDQERIRSLVGRDCLEINAETLRFTKKETERFVRSAGINIKRTDLDSLFKETEGWPMAVYLVCQLLVNEDGAALSSTANIRFPELDDLFESGFYHKYPSEYQRMLVCFSFLPSFSLEMMHTFQPSSSVLFSEAIRENVFISYDYNGQTFSFHPMYQSFLQQNRYTVTNKELETAYNIAGDWFFVHGCYFEAIACYYQCPCFEEMSEAIRMLLLSNPSDIPAAYLLSYLKKLPKDFLSEHPEIRFIIALLYVSQLALRKANTLLLEIEAELKIPTRNEERTKLLGEVYAMLANIAVLRNDASCFTYYPKAATLLEGGSHYHSKMLMYAGNNNLLFLPGNQSGLLQKTVENVMASAQYTMHYMNGLAYGFEYLFAAEAAYAICDTTSAYENCHRAIFRAMKEQQHDIICNAFFFQLRCSLFDGSYVGVQQSLLAVQEYCEKYNIDKLLDIYDTARGWLYLRLGLLDKIPKWIVEYDESRYTRLPIAIGRNKIVHAHYLSVKQRYHECIAYLDELEEVYQESALWTIRLHHYILKAICLLETGAGEEALANLYKAYEMTHENNVIMYFAEYSGGIKPLLQFARKQTDISFSSRWLNTVQNKIETFNKGITAVKKEQQKEKSEPPLTVHLSRREREVLASLVNGKTRNEIARELGISVNSVKTHLKGAYSKIGAANKADAIRFAINMDIQ